MASTGKQYQNHAATIISWARQDHPASQHRIYESEEYETDHLIYCSKYNTPRQCRHELQGKVLIPSIRCKCQQEIFEQEETQRKLHERQMEIKHLKTSGLQDKALYDYTFANDNGINPEMKLAHNYVSSWEEMKANASGFAIVHEKTGQHLLCHFKHMVNTVNLMMINQDMVQHHSNVVHPGICIRRQWPVYPIFISSCKVV